MKIYKDFPLDTILYYRIGGRAKVVVEIKDKKDLVEAISLFKKEKIRKIMPIGLGSNLLFSDKFFDGAILWFKDDSQSIILKDEVTVEAFAAVALDTLIQFSFKNLLLGFEWAGGLPGTVGAAVRGNAGAFGHEIRENLESVEIFNLNNNQIQSLSKDDLKFSYRQSIIKQRKNLIIVSATFILKKETNKGVEEAKNVYQACINHRNKNNPMDYPSCGSVFKNITDEKSVNKIIKVWPDIKDLVVKKWHNKVSMGYVIKRLGLSNLKQGGAVISDKHSNFILNIDNAKFDDAFFLIEKIKESFFAKFNFSPEIEVEIIN